MHLVLITLAEFTAGCLLVAAVVAFVDGVQSLRQQEAERVERTSSSPDPDGPSWAAPPYAEVDQ